MKTREHGQGKFRLKGIVGKIREVLAGEPRKNPGTPKCCGGSSSGGQDACCQYRSSS